MGVSRQHDRSEFHAVWVSPDGGFLGVTPKADGERQILFIPDPERVYQRRHVEKVRLALTDGPAVHRMIRMDEELGELRRKYNDPDRVSRRPSVSECMELGLLEKRKARP